MNVPSDLDANPPQVPQIEQEPLLEKEEKGEVGSAFQEFAAKLAGLASHEERIAYGLEFMRNAISQEGSPRFREFWEARRLILPYFKENINPAIRSKFWNDYVELTVEGRRLKEILEEQSVFAVEQIDLAVQAVESDLQNCTTLLEQSDNVYFPERCIDLVGRMDAYQKTQRELHLYNALASRLNSLRREVMKTEMRVRFKTKFFKKLSELGDQVFPKRKELIETVSAAFLQDVEQFITHYFTADEGMRAPYYVLREDIKALQSMAKILTLSSSAFNQTRTKLSACWDQVKELEKEHKKEQGEKKQASLEQRNLLEQEVAALREKTADLAMPLNELDKEIEQILAKMRTVTLHRDDVFFLRDALSKLRSPYIAAREQKAKELEEAEKEILRQKKEKMTSLKEEIATLQKEGGEMPLDLFTARFDEILRGIESLELTKMEKQQFDRLLRYIKDLLAEKKEQSLINLSEDDRKALENLRTVLQQKKERRQEIKQTLEGYRKVLGGSSLDFSKAMQIRELIDQEKERLEKANLGIQEIESKIAELEG